MTEISVQIIFKVSDTKECMANIVFSLNFETILVSILFSSLHMNSFTFSNSLIELYLQFNFSLVDLNIGAKLY